MKPRLVIIAPHDNTDDIAVEEMAQTDNGHVVVSGHWVQLGDAHQQLARDLDDLTIYANIAVKEMAGATPECQPDDDTIKLARSVQAAAARVRAAAGLDEGEAT